MRPEIDPELSKYFSASFSSCISRQRFCPHYVVHDLASTISHFCFRLIFYFFHLGLLKYFRTLYMVTVGPPAWGLGEVLTTPPREKTLLRNIHKARCFLWRQNNPEVNYCSKLLHKKKAYLKVKVEELETNSKVRDLYRGINDFKKGYQPRTTIVKDEKGALVTNPHSILARWRNYFSQL